LTTAAGLDTRLTTPASLDAGLTAPATVDDTSSRWLDRLAFVAVGVLVLAITWNGIRITGGAFANGFLVLATVAVLAHVIVDRRPIPVPPWLLVTAGAMVIAALIESVFPPSPAVQSKSALWFVQVFLNTGQQINVPVPPRSNVAALIKWELALLFIPILIGIVARNPWRINRLLDLWTVSAVISALVGIVGGGFGHRAAGLTLQSNYLALTCCLAVPTALRWVGRSNRATLAGLGATLILIGGEYATGSRDGNVSMAIAVVGSVIFLPRLRRWATVVLPVLVAGIAAVLLFTHAGHSILKQLRLTGATQQTYGSNYQRSLAKNIAETQISNRPIAGVGFSVDNDAQNIYYQILAAGGVITMLGFVVFVGGLGTCVRRSLPGPLREPAIAIGVCVVVYLVNGWYDAQIADKYLYVLPGILFACARVTGTLRASPPPAAIARATTPPRPVLEPVLSRGSPALR
jgi:hypothetical protein